MLKIEITIWDNTTCVAEKADILLRCERTMRKLAKLSNIKVTERNWAGFTAEINLKPADEINFVFAYCEKLRRFHYWNRDNEPICMDSTFSWEQEDDGYYFDDDELDSASLVNSREIVRYPQGYKYAMAE